MNLIQKKWRDLSKEERKEEFTKRIGFLSRTSSSSPEWKQRIEVAQKIATLNFNCDFDSTGKCKEARIPKSDRVFAEQDHIKGTKLLADVCCCCHKCLKYIGYGVVIPEDKINAVYRLFSIRTGFYRKGKGCRLPHEYRSDTCLRYNCTRDHKFTEKVEDLTYGMFRGIKRTRK